MSLLWVTAAVFKDSDIFHHPDPQSLDPASTAKIPLRFEYEQTGTSSGGVWKAKVPDDHPGHKEHGWLAGYAHIEHKYLPDDHPEDPGGYTTHIKMVETNPGYEGQGVGKALLQHVMKNSGYHGVTHGGFTEAGAGMWNSVTGQNVRKSTETTGRHRRNWRWAV